MALKTLKGVNKIGGYEITRNNEHDASRHVLIDDKSNTIAFKIQNGPIKENGVNGCQVDTLIHAAKIILEGLEDIKPCYNNHMAIYCLEEAIGQLDARKSDREDRGVEGTSKS
jgi:hypothetical protein